MRLLKLNLRKVRVGLVLLGSALLMASSPGACGSSTSESPFPAAFTGAPSVAYLAEVPSLLWSRNSEHIVFSRGLHGVFVVDAAGRRLRAFPEYAPTVGDYYNPGAFAPALSTDGTRMAYSVFVPTNGAQIETAAFDGSDVQRVTTFRDLDGDGRTDTVQNTNPAWSPDGEKIAFVSDRRLSTMAVDGSNARTLSLLVRLDRHQSPHWSPDGTHIAFVGFDKEYNPGFYTVRLDGYELTRLADARASSVAAPVWSPNGGWLALATVETDAEGTKHDVLYTVRPDGSFLTRVTPTDYGGSVFAWSPDGDWLAFSNGQTVYVTRPNGAELRQVAIGNGVPLVWTPDGEEILIKRLGHAVRADGGGLREWVSGGVPGIVRTAWSPDGSRLAVLSAPESHSLMLYTIARDGMDKQLVARGGGSRLVAEHSDWRDVSDDIAACTEQYKRNPALVEDCQTLLSIRDTLAGETLLNWSADVHIGDWEGVSIEGGEGADLRPPRVRKLVLSGEYSHAFITGVIPPKIGALGELEFLNLSRNSLTGGIPPELSMLSKLETLYLEDNNLTGSIPPELGNLASLKYLSLSGNTLSGDVPPELGNLENLRTLELHRNYDLSGCVPAVLASRLTQEYGTGLEYCE